MEELVMATKQAQRESEKTLQRYEAMAAEQAVECCRLGQLDVAVEAGDVSDVLLEEERRLRKMAGLDLKKPRLTKSAHDVIQALAGTMPQKGIAGYVGTSAASVSRHLNPKPRTPKPLGREPSLTPTMLFAAARFQFICNTTCLNRTKAFIQMAFNKAVHTRTISRHLKGQTDFSLWRFPPLSS